MGPLGWQETIFIFVLALLIFGPKKLPELGKTIGKAMTEFRRASSELRHTWDREMAAMERETESLRDVTNKVDNEISQSTYDYNSSYYDSSYDYGYGTDNNTPSGNAEPSTVGASATQGAEPTATGTELATTTQTAAAEAPKIPESGVAEAKT
jgi:TatA/E family protein of Tat protein translocase